MYIPGLSRFQDAGEEIYIFGWRIFRGLRINRRTINSTSGKELNPLSQPTDLVKIISSLCGMFPLTDAVFNLQVAGCDGGECAEKVPGSGVPVGSWSWIHGIECCDACQWESHHSAWFCMVYVACVGR